MIGNILPPEIWRKFLEQVLKTLDDFNDRFIDDLGNPIQRARQAESFALSTSSNVANPIQRARQAESFALSTSSNVANSRRSIPLTSNPPLPTDARASRCSLSQAGPSQVSATNIDRRRNLGEGTDIVMIDDDEEDDDIVVVQSRSSREIVDLTKE